MADDNRLLTLVNHLVAALEDSGREYGHRREYKKVERFLYDVGLERDWDHITLQVGLGSDEQPTVDGFDHSTTRIRRRDDVLVRAHIGPDKRADESLDLITPVLDVEADIEALVMATRSRGDSFATTYYRGTVREFHGTEDGIGATVTATFAIEWDHTTGDTSSV